MIKSAHDNFNSFFSVLDINISPSSFIFFYIYTGVLFHFTETFVNLILALLVISHLKLLSHLSIYWVLADTWTKKKLKCSWSDQEEILLTNLMFVHYIRFCNVLLLFYELFQLETLPLLYWCITLPSSGECCIW